MYRITRESLLSIEYEDELLVEIVSWTVYASTIPQQLFNRISEIQLGPQKVSSHVCLVLRILPHGMDGKVERFAASIIP